MNRPDKLQIINANQLNNEKKNVNYFDLFSVHGSLRL